MAAKNGAPVYALLPPITPIRPHSPLCAELSNTGGIRTIVDQSEEDVVRIKEETDLLIARRDEWKERGIWRGSETETET